MSAATGPVRRVFHVRFESKNQVARFSMSSQVGLFSEAKYRHEPRTFFLARRLPCKFVFKTLDGPCKSLGMASSQPLNIQMSPPGVEPGLSRPRHDVLTTIDDKDSASRGRLCTLFILEQSLIHQTGFCKALQVWGCVANAFRVQGLGKDNLIPFFSILHLRAQIFRKH